VIGQARRRVLDGEQVPTSEKIYSIFEPHTDLIKRGKVRAPVEFGHKVFLAESAKGLVTQYEMLRGNRRTKSMWRRRSSATAASSAAHPPSSRLGLSEGNLLRLTGANAILLLR
jgi:hypothetical protein